MFEFTDLGTMSAPFNPCGGMAALHRVTLHLCTSDHLPPLSRAPSSGPSKHLLLPLHGPQVWCKRAWTICLLADLHLQVLTLRPGGGPDTALSVPMQGLTLDLPALAESLLVLPLHQVLGIEVKFLQGCELPDVLQRSSADVPPVGAERAPQVRLCTCRCTALHVLSAAWPPCCDNAFTSCSLFSPLLQADDGLPAGSWPQPGAHTRP